MVLRALIDENDNPDLREGSQKLLRSKGGPLEVCHVSIGEAFATMIEDQERTVDDCLEATRSFHHMIKNGSLSICGFHNHKDTHKLALELHNKDSLLEPNDGIILANALLCRNCQTFYTMDNRMLFGRVALNAAKELGKSIEAPPVLDTIKNRKKRFGH